MNNIVEQKSNLAKLLATENVTVHTKMYRPHHSTPKQESLYYQSGRK